MTDWRSGAMAFVVAIGFSVISTNTEPGVATQGTLIRFALVAAAIGVLLALEDFEGESTAALPVPMAVRLGARLVSVASIWALTIVAVLFISRIGSTQRIVTEATVLCLIAVLLASIGRRTGIPGFTTLAAAGAAALFVATLLIPARLSPWWDGVNPSREPTAVTWYLAGCVLAFATLRVSRRIDSWGVH